MVVHGDNKPEFQSTLPRRERRVVDVCRDHADEISIHAPAKGATLPATPVRASFRISIHAPAKGATVMDSMRPFST